MKRLTVHLIVALVAILLSCGRQAPESEQQSKNPYRLTIELALRGIDWTEASLRRTLAVTGEQFPIATENGQWELGHDGWTGGYWAGMLWMMWQRTGDDFWLAAAEKYTKLLEPHKTDADNSDICILLWPSADLGYSLTGNEEYRDVGIEAARTMMKRYIETGGYFQNWGALGDQEQMGFVIIDCLINLDHMFWATQVTGDSSFALAAASHARRSMASHVRADYSSHQVVELDPSDGRMIRGFHKQGYGDETTWSRGQAWGVYGFTRAYRHTKDPRFLETAIKMSDWFISHLPEDMVPYWDFNLPPDVDHARDTSAGSMAASGLLELATLVENPADAARYRDAAGKILASLTINYLTKGLSGEPYGVLTGSTYFFAAGRSINQANIWGDFYYLEALLRWLEPDFWLNDEVYVNE